MNAAARLDGRVLPAARWLAGFVDADADLLARRALLDRQDARFALPFDRLPALLDGWRPSHAVLLAGRSPVATYDTVYFDTAGLRLFHDHRRGRGRRFKVRIRRYPERDLSMLEVKARVPGGRTRKHRRPFGTRVSLDDDDRGFIAQHGVCDVASLRPVITTRFRRITLLGRASDERVTIDFDLAFAHDDAWIDAGPLVVVELKAPRLNGASTTFRELRRSALADTPPSKFYAAVVLHRLASPGRLAPAFRLFRRSAP